MNQVTRVEIADHVEGIFDKGAASPVELKAEAVRTNARPAVLDALSELHHEHYSGL